MIILYLVYKMYNYTRNIVQIHRIILPVTGTPDIFRHMETIIYDELSWISTSYNNTERLYPTVQYV